MLMQPQAMLPVGFDPNAYYMPGASGCTIPQLTDWFPEFFV